METTTFIYALCEPNSRTVRYTGKSNRPKRRFKDHLKYSAKKKTPLGDWLRGLSEKPILVILREVLVEEWEMAEERYIRLARGCGMKLVNSTDGGEGITMTPEICAKISASKIGEKNPMFGKKHTPEAGAKMSISRTGEKNYWFGKKHPPEMRAKNSAAKAGENHPCFGKKHTPEHCAHISAALTGENNPMFGKQHTPESNLKRRAALVGEKNHMFGKKGQKSPNFGKKHTHESCAKRSASLKKYHAAKKENAARV